MPHISSTDLYQKYIAFFVEKQHAQIPSAPLVPQGDSTALFNVAGMQPLLPYFLGATHPLGKRIVNVQKCIRTIDIDDVWDATHLTFFNMLWNRSFGDYFKKESIAYSWEFLTSKEKGLWLDPTMLSITVFAGDADAPRDEESATIWLEQWVPASRIAYLPKEDNRWAIWDTGPCGPDTEIFYWIGEGTPAADSNVGNDSKNRMEIWNNVFMEYNRVDENTLQKLPSQNVDTGMGLERTLALLNGHKSVYDTDIFTPLFAWMYEAFSINPGENQTSLRIIADHIRAAVNLIADWVVPKNVQQGYILRRLLRRAIREAYKLWYENPFTAQLGAIAIDSSVILDPALADRKEIILDELVKEESKFAKTLKNGMRELEKMIRKWDWTMLSGKDAFMLFESFGFPIEMTVEIAREQWIQVDTASFEDHYKQHQLKSQTASKWQFTSGLWDSSDATIKLHTACHLMLAGLRSILGEHVHQAWSNITAERLRFDITHPEKITSEQLEQVTQYVNQAIQADLQVSMRQENKDEAKARWVEWSFWDKYPDQLKVYTMQDATGKIYSEEVCNWPHVEHTGGMWTFKIIEESGVGNGVRRIKGVLV